MNAGFRGSLVTLALVAGTLLAGCERPPVETVQRGYRGLGMVEVYNPRLAQRVVDANSVPAPQAAAAPGTPPATTTFKNVTVLTDLNTGEFIRLMLAMTEWVAPEQGCVYCHEAADFASDKPYAKVVARQMLQMTRKVNADWKSHVSSTGVTCFTCHRGNPVPKQAWTADAGPLVKSSVMGNRAGQNLAAPAAGLTSLPYDPLSAFAGRESAVRVVGTSALPESGVTGASLPHTEWTYAFMMNISQSLGVNCTFCHNSRSFAEWDASTPQRAVAWHGIRMVQNLNAEFLAPLAGTLPPERLGAQGDVPKVGCGTCHQGVYKPLMGASMLADYPELAMVPVKK